jgi:hypothetical protein
MLLTLSTPSQQTSSSGGVGGVRIKPKGHLLCMQGITPPLAAIPGSGMIILLKEKLSALKFTGSITKIKI